MSPFKVTDHAVLRYLERELGVDIESVREAIADKVESSAVRKLVEFAGGEPCKIKADGGVFCFSGSALTTYWSATSRPMWAPIGRRRRGEAASLRGGRCRDTVPSKSSTPNRGHVVAPAKAVVGPSR